MVSNINTSVPEGVYEEMEYLIQQYNEDETHTVENIAKLHADFEKIHPFQDDNANTGQMSQVL